MTAVVLFSKLNEKCFGFFDAETVFLDNEKIIYFGVTFMIFWLTNNQCAAVSKRVHTNHGRVSAKYIIHPRNCKISIDRVQKSLD